MIGKLAGERIGERLIPEMALQFQQVLASCCVTCAGVIMEEFRGDVLHKTGVLVLGPLPPSAATQKSEGGKARWENRAGYDPADDGE